MSLSQGHDSFYYGPDHAPTRRMVNLNTNVQHWLNEWASARDVTERRRKADDYRITRYILPYFSRRSVTRLTTEQVESWIHTLEQEGVGASTIYASKMILRQAITLALLELGLSDTKPNPVSEIPSNQTVIRPVEIDEILTEDEFKAIVHNIDPFFEAMILFLGRTGARWNETQGMRAEDLYLRDGMATIGRVLTVDLYGHIETKPGDKRLIRLVTLSEDLVDSLKRFLAETAAARATLDSGALFFSKRDHKPLLSPNFRIHVWRPALRAAGLDEKAIQIGSLRHMAAARMIERGDSVEDISKAIGHQSVLTTRMTYKNLLLARGMAEDDMA